MAFQSVPDTAQVTWFFEGTAATNLLGCEAEFSCYLRNTAAAWNTVNLGVIADYASDWWDSDYKALTSTDWTFVRVTARDLEAEFGTVAEVVRSDPGARAGDPVPPQVTAYMPFTVASGGAPRRGGMHFNAGVEADIDGNTWAAAFRTELNLAWDGFVGGLGGVLPFTAHVLVSRYTGGDTAAERAALRAAIAASRRGTGVTNTLAGAYLMRPEPGSQRDRRASV